MNDLIARRKRRFILIVRLMYLVAFSLIGAGLYISNQQTIQSIGDQGADTDFNNTNISDLVSGNDISKLQSLTVEDIDGLIKGLNPTANGIVTNLDNIIDLADSLKDQSTYVVEKNGQKLSSILTEKLKERYPNATLNQQDLRALTRKSSGLLKLTKGQRLSVTFNEQGNINYLSWFKEPKLEVSFLKQGDTYIQHTEQKQSTFHDAVLPTITVGSNLESSLRSLGVSSPNARGISDILDWQLGRNSARGGKLTILAKQEYVGDVIVTPNYATLAAKLVVNGKAYYAIGFNTIWYSENGFRESEVSFQRYPFQFKPIVTSQFNPHRRNPVTGRVSPHNGVDFGVTRGTPIVAPADGKVLRVASQPSGAGNYLVIQHDQTYATVYMHLTRALVSPGEKVVRGQRIALSGNTGRSTGPHLHYEVHVNGVPMNPLTVHLPTLTSSNVNNNRKFLGLSRTYVNELNSRRRK